MNRGTEFSVTLVIIGVICLMPPIVTLFYSAQNLLGIPLIVVYIFGAWTALILCAVLLSLLDRQSS